jgi:hypothetical protein
MDIAPEVICRFCVEHEVTPPGIFCEGLRCGEALKQWYEQGTQDEEDDGAYTA